MRQTAMSLNKRDRRMVDEFRSKGLHMAREFNRREFTRDHLYFRLHERAFPPAREG